MGVQNWPALGKVAVLRDAHVGGVTAPNSVAIRLAGLPCPGTAPSTLHVLWVREQVCMATKIGELKRFLLPCALLHHTAILVGVQGPVNIIQGKYTHTTSR